MAGDARLSPATNRLKKVAVFGACFGVAVALTVVAAVPVWQWYRSTRPWDADSIKCLSSSALQFYTDPLDSRRGWKVDGFEFSFVLENTTNRDYTVPQDLKLLKREEGSEALDHFDAKLDHSIMIPAKERALLRVDVEYSCSTIDSDTRRETERDPQTCFKDAFGTVSGFVGLDRQTRTRLNLLKPVFRPPIPAAFEPQELPTSSAEKPKHR
jgi:hypothetical protein